MEHSELNLGYKRFEVPITLHVLIHPITIVLFLVPLAIILHRNVSHRWIVGEAFESGFKDLRQLKPLQVKKSNVIFFTFVEEIMMYPLLAAASRFLIIQYSQNYRSLKNRYH